MLCNLSVAGHSSQHNSVVLTRLCIIGFHKMREISSVTEELLASKEGLCSMQLVANSVFFMHEIDI